jgi:transketolase
MRLQPGLTVLAPADHRQTRTALEKSWNLPGPVYYRLGKNDKTVVPGLDGRFGMGGAELVRDGSDILMVTAGSISAEVVGAAEILSSQNIHCAVLVAASLNPAPLAELAERLGRYRVAMTVEAHYVAGGLGSCVAEVIAEHELPCRLVRCGVRRTPDALTGRLDYLNHQHGISREALVETAQMALSS